MPPQKLDIVDNTLHQRLQDFYEWLEKNKTKAVSSESDSAERFFLSRKLLKEYFGNENRTKQIYQAVCGSPLVIDFDDFLNDWVCVFALLLSLGHGNAIPHFISNHLYDSKHPFQERPSQFPFSPLDDEFWSMYQKAQWLFFPLELKKNHHRQRVPEARVLPIIKKESIGRGGSSKIYRIERNPATHKTYVVKEYLPGEAEEYYEAEIEGHSLTRSSGAIVSCYGSFRQDTPRGPALSLILEYADAGTLEEYFQAKSQPSTRTNMIAFWENLQQLALALSDLHTNYLPQLEQDKPRDVLLG
ncbi:MAG: hypothetical protein Q9160_002340 [Pyrenula sp. 1 TL-2023]